MSEKIIGGGMGEHEEHIVIGRDRSIIIPESLKKIAVQFDHNIETVTFDCPCFWDDIDLSKMEVYINYVRSDGYKGTCLCTNVRYKGSWDMATGPETMCFDWTVSRNVTLSNGHITFLVCIKQTDDAGNEIHHWNSEMSTEMYISEGLECGEVIAEEYPDIIEQILKTGSGLVCKDIVSPLGGPIADSYYIDLSKFNRTPVRGETFVAYRLDSENNIYLEFCTVGMVDAVQAQVSMNSSYVINKPGSSFVATSAIVTANPSIGNQYTINGGDILLYYNHDRLSYLLVDDCFMDGLSNVYVVASVSDGVVTCTFTGLNLAPKKEAYIQSYYYESHASALPMLCVSAPYANNEIVSIVLWTTNNGAGHYYMQNKVDISTGGVAVLTDGYGQYIRIHFPSFGTPVSYGNGTKYYTLYNQEGYGDTIKMYYSSDGVTDGDPVNVSDFVSHWEGMVIRSYE